MPQPKTPSAPSHQGRSASGKVPGAGLHSISTTGYTCPELTRAPVRAGACDAFKLPSRSAFTK